MKYKCAIMQPTYIPWIGYFSMIDQVDKFVFLDTVQLARRSWQIRNRVKTYDGEIILTVPIIRDKHRDEHRIMDARINYNENWVKKHLQTFKHNYSKSKYFEEVYELFNSIYSRKIENIGELNSTIIISICDKIGINTEFYKSSTLDNISGSKDELLVSICKSIESDNYLSALGSAEYIEKNNKGGAFSKSKIDIEYQNYNHPKYDQLNGEFLEYMSIVDLLFNYGFENSLFIIRSGNLKSIYSDDFIVERGK